MALALGARAHAGLAAEVDRHRLAVGALGVVAEIELQLPVLDLVVAHQLQLGTERPAGLGTKAFQRADLVVTQEGFDLVQLEAAAGRDLGHAETATFGIRAPGRRCCGAAPRGQPTGLGRHGTGCTAAAGAGAGESPVVLLHHAAAVGAGRGQRGVVARDGVAVVFLGLAHDALGHRRDVLHEGRAAQLALLHLGQLEFPVAGELGLGQVFDRQATQQRHQLKRLGGGAQLAAFAQDVLFGDQTLDHLGAGGGRAQALLGHGLAQLVVVDQLARALHRAQQGGFGVTRRRLGLQRVDGDMLVGHGLAGLHRHQVGVFVLRFLAVDRQPARVDQHLAVGLEVVAFDLGDAGGDHELGRRVEHRDEALDHQVVKLGLDLGQAPGRLQRGDDGEVVGYLAVVEHPLGGLHITFVQALARVQGQGFQRAGQVFVRDHLEGLPDRGQVVLGQRARIGPRVGQHLVLLVQRLGDGERGLGAEAEAAVGLALQGGQVVEQRAAGVAGLGLLGHRAGLAQHRVADGVGVALVPQPVGPAVGVGRGVRAGALGRTLPELGVEPLAFVAAGPGLEVGLDFPVIARDMLADLFFALDHDRQRGRLHPAHGGQKEAAVARVESRHRPRAVDADQPVGLAAAACGIGQAQHLLVAAQVVEAIADRLRRHALQPQPADRLGQRRLEHGSAGDLLAIAGILHDQPEDQLALAAGVAGVDQVAHILALDQLDQRVEPALGLVDGCQVEVRRHHRQVGKTPLAALDVVLVGGLDLHQVAHRRADHVAVVLEVVFMLVELAGHGGQRAHDVLGHAGLLGNDEGLAHGSDRILWEGRCRPCLQSAAFTRAPALVCTHAPMDSL